MSMSRTLSEENSRSTHKQLSAGPDSPVKQHLSLHEPSMCSTNTHTLSHTQTRGRTLIRPNPTTHQLLHKKMTSQIRAGDWSLGCQRVIPGLFPCQKSSHVDSQTDSAVNSRFCLFISTGAME